jgi:hypothetical protein
MHIFFYASTVSVMNLMSTSLSRIYALYACDTFPFFWMSRLAFRMWPLSRTWTSHTITGSVRSSIESERFRWLMAARIDAKCLNGAWRLFFYFYFYFSVLPFSNRFLMSISSLQFRHNLKSIIICQTVTTWLCSLSMTRSFCLFLNNSDHRPTDTRQHSFTHYVRAIFISFSACVVYNRIIS